MSDWPWIERTFQFGYPPAKFPELLERLRGTPARLEEMLAGLAPERLTDNYGSGWSILENVGHLIDLGYLPAQRIEQILGGEEVLIAADMTNRKTHQADHNSRSPAELLAEFRRERSQLVQRLEHLPESDWGRGALHPRIRVPMRIVDIVCFDSEHDDYHLARIRKLIAKGASACP